MNKEVTILLKSMTSEQLLELSANIEKQLAEVKFDELTDLRKMKPFCPRCKSSQIKKVGFSKTCSKQSYQCKECERKFFISCNSLTHATKKTLGAWMKAIESVLNYDTLDQMTIKCDIHRTTAFYWRHKIFDRINELVNKDMLSGEIYLDETLVPVSFEKPIEAKNVE